MSTVGGPRLIPTVPGGSSRPNKTSSVKESKFSKLLLKPFCQITAELYQSLPAASRIFRTNVAFNLHFTFSITGVKIFKSWS